MIDFDVVTGPGPATAPTLSRTEATPRPPKPSQRADRVDTTAGVSEGGATSPPPPSLAPSQAS